MKKLVLAAAAAAAISAASAATPANALTVIKSGCCGASAHAAGGVCVSVRVICHPEENPMKKARDGAGLSHT